MIILLSIAISRPVSGECLRAQHTTIMYIQSATDPISLMLAAAFPRSDSLHKLFSVPIRREHLCVLSRPGFCVWRKHANNTRPNSTHTTKIVVGRLNYLLFWAGRQIARLASLNNRQNNRNSQLGVEPELFAAAMLLLHHPIIEWHFFLAQCVLFKSCLCQFISIYSRYSSSFSLSKVWMAGGNLYLSTERLSIYSRPIGYDSLLLYCTQQI